MRLATTHWVSELFPDDYVRSMRAQFAAFGHEITVLGNGADHDRKLKFPRGLSHRWWTKLEWFAPWNADLRPAVVFDLDTFIIGDPAPFLDLDPKGLWMIREFLSRFRGESGIFVAPDDDDLCAKVWDAAMTREPGADGALLREFPHQFIPDVIPGIYSWEAHCKKGPPDDARVVCFHGWNKSATVAGWAHDWWLTSLNSQPTS